jgi:hypothetical protein
MHDLVEPPPEPAALAVWALLLEQTRPKAAGEFYEAARGALLLAVVCR